MASPQLGSAPEGHSSILAWRIPSTEELGGLQSIGVTESRTQLSNFHWGSKEIKRPGHR